MSFYMDVTSMLDDYGVDIEVWKSDKPHTGKKSLWVVFIYLMNNLPCLMKKQQRNDMSR